MIARLIRWSVANRFLVLLAAAFVAIAGVWAVRTTPLDAIPDLSDTQVIIRTTYPGQAPQIVEDQVTYPLTTTMLSVPGAKVVRGYSFFGDSFVYILFEDGTDIYFARSRVLEYLNQVQGRLPPGAKPSLGPDATGVGWIYEYALVDRSGKHDLAELRALQDWFLKYELKTVPDVAEVATVGGMVKQYQVVLDPARLKAYNLPVMKVIAAIRDANREFGGSVLELAEAEYMVRVKGYLRSLDDFRRIPVKASEGGTPVLLADIARIQVGPEMRRGIAELDGEGEVVGGVVVLRSGKNAWAAIQAVKAKLAQLKPGLPEGVEIVETYDRSALIERAVTHLRDKLAEEFAVVAIVCLAFLLHLRSALVAVVSLPLGVLGAFIVMRAQGVNADIMSLGGIAIAVGAMVDAAIVMVENAHKKLEAWRQAQPAPAGGGRPPEPPAAERWRLIVEASVEVGPALFFSLLIITLSFVPVFALEAQEGRMFKPLAFTKTYAMAASALLAVTLVPVLMGYVIRGRIPSEHANPLNRWLIAAYRPQLRVALRWPKTTLAFAALALAATAYPVLKLGGEFMPPLDEGDLLYMPTALPGLSAGKAGELLQQTDRMIKQIPEVKTRLRQDRARRDGDRSRAARDDRDHDPVQAARRMASRHDDGQAHRRARPRRARAGAFQHLGAADPQSHRHAGDRHQEPDRDQGRRCGSCRGQPRDAGDRARGAGRARRHLGAGRAARGRTLHRRDHRPGGGGALRSQHHRDPGRHRRGRGRREHRRDGRGARALSDQRALSARVARLHRRDPDAADRHRHGRADPAVGGRRSAHRGWPADAAQRKRAAFRLGVCRRTRPRSGVGRPRPAGGGRPRGQAAAGLFAVVVRPVRVPGARQGAARLRCAVHAAGDLRAALSRLPPRSTRR